MAPLAPPVPASLWFNRKSTVLNIDTQNQDMLLLGIVRCLKFAYFSFHSFGLFKISDVHTTYYRLVRVTSLEQLSLSELSGEQARPKVNKKTTKMLPGFGSIR